MGNPARIESSDLDRLSDVLLNTRESRRKLYFQKADDGRPAESEGRSLQALKLGLVVQGPLVSEGRTGRSLRLGQSKNDWATYRCASNIARLVRHAKEAGYAEIVLSTWDSERHLVPQDIGCDVIFSAPPIERTRFRPTKLGNLPVNDRKQLYSSIQGFNHLKTLGVTHALKVRTDQWVDLAAIAAVFDLFKSRIVLPEKLIGREDYVNDFFFAGPIHELLLFSRASAEFVPVKKNIHNNLFYAYARTKGLNLRFPLDFYWRRQNPVHKVTSLERYMWNRYFDVLPESILSGLVWRGEAAT